MIDMVPPWAPRWLNIGVLSLWLCGWVVGECFLLATMFGADIHWRGGNIPPMWSLVILTAFWTTVGLWAIRTLIRTWRRRI